MIIRAERPSRRSWGRQVGTAAGATIAGAAISLLGIASSHADTTDATVGAIGDATVGNIGDLLTVDAAVSPITAAIDAAEAPINTAQALIDAVPTASLGADDLALLMTQETLNTQLLDTIGALGTYQAGLTYADPAYLADVDSIMTALNTDVLDATQSFLGTLADPELDFSAGLELVTADLGAALGTASAFGLSVYGEIAGFLGIDLVTS